MGRGTCDMTTCFFIGHRDAPESLMPRLEEIVERHITAWGVTDFVVGHYGNFDALAALAVRNAKKRHPLVTLTLLLPCHPYDRPEAAPKGFDGTFYPPAWRRSQGGWLLSGQTATWWITAAISLRMPGIRPAMPGHWRTMPVRGLGKGISWSRGSSLLPAAW